MPLFKIAKQPVSIWLPGRRILSMETAPGGLTTYVRAAVLTEKGEGLGTFEVEGLIEHLGPALDGASDR